MMHLTVHSDSLDSLMAQIVSISPGGSAYDQAMSAAADGLLACMSSRIHTDGIASDGSRIGQYSTRPIYVNPLRSPQRFDTMGRTGRDTFGRPGPGLSKAHKTKYFAGGYAEYHGDMGLVADRVILVLSGSLRDQLSVSRTDSGYGLGWPGDEMAARADALEDKYGKAIWQPTAEEISQCAAVLMNYWQALMHEGK